MTDKEKILALEIENARLKEVLGVAEKALTAQPPSYVIGNLKDLDAILFGVENTTSHVCNAEYNGKRDEKLDYCLKCKMERALVILKEIGID